jgi:hypothetical protein
MNIESSVNIVKEKNKKEVTMPHPMDIYHKFKEVLGVDDIRVNIEDKKILSNEGELQIAYDKYLFMADLNSEISFNGIYPHSKKVGIIVCNSSNKMKIFSGMEAKACLNMSIFGADSIIEENINTILIKANVGKVLKVSEEKELQWKNKILNWINTTYNTESSWNNRKGEILTKMATNLFGYIKHAEEQMRDKNSLYYDMPDSDWKLLSAMTDKNKNVGLTSRINHIEQLEYLFL